MCTATSDLVADNCNISLLLELAACDDLEIFRSLVEQDTFDVNESGLWYGRSFGSKKMKVEDRTPLMIASMFGSLNVLKFILGFKSVDVNKCCGSDKATALHMAVDGGSSSSVEVVKLLIEASADVDCLDVNGNRPADLIPLVFGSCFDSRRRLLDIMLNSCSDGKESVKLVEEHKGPPNFVKKEYPVVYPNDLSLPDMNSGVYNTDEFRMYAFKIKPCSRAYSHDWTECPFVHPGENARRRDPRKYHYSCVPCPDFRKGFCRLGDGCDYAHGIFECWLHPAQYRTRLCKDEVGCSRKVCFFAHKPEELRPLHPSTGSAILSPQSLSDISLSNPFSSPRGGPIWSNQSTANMKVLSSRFRGAPSSQDLDLEAELMLVDRYRQHQLIDAARVSPPFSSGYFEEYDAPRIPSSSFGANQMMNSRAAAYAKRSQSFIDRGAVNFQPGSSSEVASKLSGWGSPDGKLNWGVEKDELNKLRKSASFGVRRSPDSSSIVSSQDHDVTFDEEQHFLPLMDQLYMEQEQLVA